MLKFFYICITKNVVIKFYLMKVEPLTKAEEQIMQVLWKLEAGFLKDILDLFREPKPHSNTVSTILKVLKEKSFVDYRVFGRQHQYFPVISKEQYSGKTMKSWVKNYFKGSYKNAVSFLVEKNELSVEDLELLLKEIKNKN